VGRRGHSSEQRLNCLNLCRPFIMMRRGAVVINRPVGTTWRLKTDWPSSELKRMASIPSTRPDPEGLRVPCDKDCATVPSLPTNYLSGTSRSRVSFLTCWATR